LNDKDGDGIPELSREFTSQFRVDGLRDSVGDAQLGEELVEQHLEHPGLAALLYNEIHQLQKLQEKVAGPPISLERNPSSSGLRDFILASWQEENHLFQTRDYESHISGKGFVLDSPFHPGWNPTQTSLPYPSRLLVRLPLPAAGQTSQETLMIFHGWDWQDRYRIEELSDTDIHWEKNAGWGITRSIFSKLDHLIVGIGEGTQYIEITAPQSNQQDLSLTLPLWMESISEELVPSLVRNTIAEPTCFWSNYGLKSYPKPDPAPISLPLNALVMKGLIQRGFSTLAKDLFLRWLSAASSNIQLKGCLFAVWDSKTGTGFGETNLVEGCLPMGMLLDLLAIRFRGSRELVVHKESPLLFPIKLRIRGNEITLKENESILRRPGQQPVHYPRGQEVLILV
jgi:hypothetical protein